MRELQILQQNMQEQTITWDHYAAFIGTMTRIMQTRVVNGTLLIRTIEALKNVHTLVNYDFNEFLRCMTRETSMKFSIAPDLCRVMAAFTNFFQNTHITIYNTTFTYIKEQNLTIIVESLHLIVVKLFQFFHKVYQVVMQTKFVFTSSQDLNDTIDKLFGKVQMLPIATQNMSELANLQQEMRAVRADNNRLQSEKDAMEQDLETAKNNLQTNIRANESLNLEIAKLKPLANKIPLLQSDKNSLTQRNDDLTNEINMLQTQIKKSNATYYEQYTNEMQLRKKLQTDMQTMRTVNEETISKLQAKLTEQEAQINTGQTEYNVAMRTKDINYESKVSEIANDYANKLQIAQTQFNEKTNRLQLQITNLENTIAQQNDQFNVKNKQLQELNSTNLQLEQQIESMKQQVYVTQQQLASIQTAAPMETDKEKVRKDELDYLLLALNNLYQNVKFFTPNLMGADLSQDLSNLQYYLAEQQEVALNQWFAKLKETTTPNDLLNFGPSASGINVLNDLKSQLVNIIPRNMLRTAEKGIIKNEELSTIDNVALISAVSLLTAQYEQFHKQSETLRIVNTELQNNYKTLENTCRNEMAILQTDLAKNKTDVMAIQNLVNTTPELDIKSVQNVRTELDAAKSKFNSLKEIKLEELKQMANASVQEEMSKLNNKIQEINSLLTKYTTVTENIFEWKTTMLTMYESLARVVAEEASSLVL